MSSPSESAAPPPPPYALFEVSSASGVARVPARGGVVRVGRAVDNDIVLGDEPAVSRQHAELVAGAGGWSVRDLASHNGTFVDGTRIAADALVPLAPGTVVGVGNVTIRLIDEAPLDGLTVEDSGAAALHGVLTSLSTREREVLALVAAGHTDDQVATALFISVKTVHSHLDRIRDKTGSRRRAELTRLAVRLGLSTPPTG